METTSPYEEMMKEIKRKTFKVKDCLIALDERYEFKELSKKLKIK
jgi:hypothetical protein